MSFDSKKAAVENGTDITIIFSQNGRVNAKLTAPALERSLDRPSYVEFKRGLKVYMYDTTLALSSTLSAKHGKYLEEEGNVYLSDSVVVINAKGERLDCNELNWDPKRKVFYSTKEVFIQSPTATLHGWGLEANEDFTEKKILKVSGPMTVEDSTSMAHDTTVNAVPAPVAPKPAGNTPAIKAPVAAPLITPPARTSRQDSVKP
ncbi:LPS export ABC transporter periplasmic protein LptC [Chitinophaga vietnamensis]|uniref:LPS export ABC transporter periplasmic protein LptC n=1 Tax=Chitinophaga vietnamensis TaxID=2593957 RepID=UPI0013759732|nr:LPS export ABC transporter periplasmic protein LptC [Chitinophaga vietnamensis]